MSLELHDWLLIVRGSLDTSENESIYYYLDLVVIHTVVDLCGIFKDYHTMRLIVKLIDVP